MSFRLPSRCRTLIVLTLAASATASAQESLERVVVRNRLYNMGGRFELGLNAGFTMVNALVDHTNLTLDLAYNIQDTFAIELLAGWAYSHHTGLASQIGQDVMQAPITPTCTGTCGWPTVVNDMANLWEMKFNGLLGLRWAPIYGKIGLLAEIPVHFQAYLWLGGGAGQFSRTSVVYCLQPGTDPGSCNNWETESRINWIGSAAVGLRFFILQGHSLKVEARNYVWPDYYLVNIDRRVAQTGGPTGTPASNPGLTNLVLLDVGYSYVF